MRRRSLKDWNGLGLAVQAYGKRAMPALEWLAELGQPTGKRKLPVRLVKGAYWDTEIKRAQEAGYDGYPVFTRKVSTDVSYLACARLHAVAARRLLSAIRHPQCPHASPRSRSWPGNDRNFEFQRLHGMGQALYEQVVGPQSHEPALPHLCAGRQP